MKSITLVKIGGSLITDKNKPFSVREDALKIIALEIKKVIESGKLLVVGHGGGSFPHVPAKKYQTHRGIINEDSLRGIVEVADAAARLHRIVIASLLEAGVNAFGIAPSATLMTRDFKVDELCTTSLDKALELGLLPVVYGDQVLDLARGCAIVSTETVLGSIGLHLIKCEYQIEKIIHCGQTIGVYDADGKTIPVLNSQNIEQYRSVIGGSGGTDVTGGMEHKVFEALDLARQGIPGLIIDGIEHGTLSDAIAGKEVLGTRIEA